MKGDFSRNTFDRRKHYTGVRLQQGRVQLDADWNEQADIVSYQRRTLATDIIGASGAPIQGGGFEITVDLASHTPRVSPGRYYVDGILCENEAPAPLPLDQQPDLTLPLPTADGVYLAYLDVWQDGVTALDDPDLLELALGGPDTATRTRTVWQVKLQPLPANQAPPSAAGWQPDPRPRPTLAARAAQAPLDNQLYRVEIHQAGPVGSGDSPASAATFKWSRDNAAAAASIENPQNSGSTDARSIVITAELGREQSGGFDPGQWVEVTDATRIANNQPGVLAKLKDVQGQILHVEGWPNPDDPAPDLPNQPILRRWDSDGAAKVTVPTANGGFLSLDGTVQVQFGGADPTFCRTGDYWLIPTRTAVAGVLWPQAGTPPAPVAQLPLGIDHHYAILARLSLAAGVWTVVSPPYRQLFLPTTLIPGPEKLNRNQDDTMSASLTVTGRLTVNQSVQANGVTVLQAPLVAATGDTPNRGLRFPGIAAGATSPAAFLQFSGTGGTPKLTLGVDDNAAFGLAQGGVEKLTLDRSGRVGIGATNPQAAVHLQGDTLLVQGSLRYVDSFGRGPQTAGLVLTSDAAGNATWQASATRQLGIPVFLVRPLLIVSSGGAAGWTAYAPDPAKVPGNVSAVILQASAAMDQPDGGAIDAFILVRKGFNEAEYILLRGRSAGGGDRVAWGGQGFFPVTQGAGGNPCSFHWAVVGPGFNNGYEIYVVGYFP